MWWESSVVHVALEGRLWKALNSSLRPCIPSRDSLSNLAYEMLNLMFCRMWLGRDSTVLHSMLEVHEGSVNILCL